MINSLLALFFFLLWRSVRAHQHHFFFVKAWISPQWISKLRPLWLSVFWSIVCELIFPDRFPHYNWTAKSAHLHFVGSRSASVFKCNLPPALLAEWMESSICHCGNTEWNGRKSQHRKLTLENKILLPLKNIHGGKTDSRWSCTSFWWTDIVIVIIPQFRYPCRPTNTDTTWLGSDISDPCRPIQWAPSHSPTPWSDISDPCMPVHSGQHPTVQHHGRTYLTHAGPSTVGSIPQSNTMVGHI